MVNYVDKFEIDNEEILIKDYRLDNVLNKKYLFIGDSYLNYGDGTDPSVNVTTYLPLYMGLSNSDYFVSAKGGAGFSRSGNTFLMLLQDAYNSLISEPDKITDIICLGGYNDQYQNYDTITSAINTFCTNAKTLFPNAKIRLGFIGWNRSNDSDIRHNLITAIRAWMSCGKYGASYIANSECINHNYNLYNGAVHPSANGAKNLAVHLSSAILNNGACDVLYYQETALQMPAQSDVEVTAVTGTIRQYLHNNILTLSTVGNLQISFNNVTITGNAINLAELGLCLIHALPEGYRINAEGLVRRNNAWEPFNGYIRFNKGVMQLVASLNLTNVTELRLMAFTETKGTLLS